MGNAQEKVTMGFFQSSLFPTTFSRWRCLFTTDDRRILNAIPPIPSLKLKARKKPEQLDGTPFIFTPGRGVTRVPKDGRKNGYDNAR